MRTNKLLETIKAQLMDEHLWGEVIAITQHGREYQFAVTDETEAPIREKLLVRIPDHSDDEFLEDDIDNILLDLAYELAQWEQKKYA